MNMKQILFRKLIKSWSFCLVLFLYLSCLLVKIIVERTGSNHLNEKLVLLNFTNYTALSGKPKKLHSVHKELTAFDICGQKEYKCVPGAKGKVSYLSLFCLWFSIQFLGWLCLLS